MKISHGHDKKTAVQAKFDAQKIAFGPIMFQAAKALRDLGILDHLFDKRKTGATMEEVAEALGLSVYGVKVLLEAGLSLEMVQVTEDLFSITKTGYFILKDELTRVNMDFVQDVNYLGMFKLEESITNGKPEGLSVFGQWDTVYEALAELPEKVRSSWFAFDHFYSDYAFPEVLPYIFESKPKKILDVGGNTGKFSIFCAGNNPDVNLTILDLPGQVAEASANIEAAGFSNRISTHALNLLDGNIPFPLGYDAIWMSQFLDCFSQEQVLSLLKRSYNALDKQGSLFILETYWDRQAYPASTYSLHGTSLYFTAIANGNSQMYHSRDMVKMVEASGFKIDRIIDNIGVSHTLFECSKA